MQREGCKYRSMRQIFWHGQKVKSTVSRTPNRWNLKNKINCCQKQWGHPQKKKKKERKIQSIQVPFLTIQKFPCCPVAAQKGWPIKKILVHNSWQNGCLPKLPHVQNLDWCQTTYLFIHPCPPDFYPNVNRPRLYVHPCSISVLQVHTPGPDLVTIISKIPNACIWLVESDFLACRPNFKTVRRKNSISKFTNRKCKHFSSKQKGHPKETISSKRWMM